MARKPIKWHDTGKYKIRRLSHSLLFTKSDELNYPSTYLL